ncbi:MAG TPA: Crp/Fnr family transcriptional regulator [Ferrovibrio sp.]|uniref:Crp/Fnr family transcriptional regulator n=1 Tax=Ferrovibrio sp. TaxID=1917215 RepID=UPI002ED06081
MTFQRLAISAGNPRNGLLRQLPASELMLLHAHLQPASYAPDMPILSPGTRLQHCDFIEQGLISLMGRTGWDKRVEVGSVGREGMLGVGAALGIEHAGHYAVTQTACQAMRIDTGRLRELLPMLPNLHRLLLRHAHERMMEAMQLSACNASHSVERRLARWLLAAGERLYPAPIEITHARLGALLGVRRAGITVALHMLEGERAIRASRSQIELRDAARLEACACACHGLLRRTLQADHPPAEQSRPCEAAPLN